MKLAFQFFGLGPKILGERFTFMASAGLLLICTAAVPRVFAQAPRKAAVAVSTPENVTFFSLYSAKAGYFRDHGLEPQMIVMSSDLAVKAMITGDVDYTSMGGVRKQRLLAFQ